jgi:hypothetical protein
LTTNSTATDTPNKRLQVKGTVLVGWGLEPQPVASFIMREADDDDTDKNDDEEEDDEENQPQPPGNDEGGDLWTSKDAFQ